MILRYRKNFKDVRNPYKLFLPSKAVILVFWYSAVGNWSFSGIESSVNDYY